MKKIIGIVGVAVIAATLFFTTDLVNNTSEDTTLASLITMNTANAEDPYLIVGIGKPVPQKCTFEVEDPTGPLVWDPRYEMMVPSTKTVDGDEIDCKGWDLAVCWSQACH